MLSQKPTFKAWSEFWQQYLRYCCCCCFFLFLLLFLLLFLMLLILLLMLLFQKPTCNVELGFDWVGVLTMLLTNNSCPVNCWPFQNQDSVYFLWLRKLFSKESLVCWMILYIKDELNQEFLLENLVESCVYRIHTPCFSNKLGLWDFYWKLHFEVIQTYLI